MRKNLLLVLVLGLISWNAHAMRISQGQWIGSGGAGLNLSPTLIMVTPQLEYIYRPNIFIGTLGQLGIGSGILFTADLAIRYQMSRPSKWQPYLEGGLGLAMASSLFDSSVGVHILTGFGVDYTLDNTTSVGTGFRLNFAPPLKSFFVSWPMIIGRFLL